MKLTDEERRIADRVAERLFLDGMRPADAWESAMDFVTERPETLGESVPVTDIGLPAWDADGEEIPPAGVAALCRDLHRAALALYQRRWTCDTLPSGEQAAMWTALRDALGLPPAPATAAGVGACEVEVRVGQGDDGTGVPLTARVVRPATDAGVGADDGTPCDDLRLTDAEREALAWAESAAANAQHPAESVLRSLLERHAKEGGA